MTHPPKARLLPLQEAGRAVGLEDSASGEAGADQRGKNSKNLEVDTAVISNCATCCRMPSGKHFTSLICSSQVCKLDMRTPTLHVVGRLNDTTLDTQ